MSTGVAATGASVASQQPNTNAAVPSTSNHQRPVAQNDPTAPIQQLVDAFLQGTSVLEFMADVVEQPGDHRQRFVTALCDFVSAAPEGTSRNACLQTLSEIGKNGAVHSRKRTLVLDVFDAAVDSGVITVKSACECVQSMLDFTFATPIDIRVVNTLHGRLKQLDYKGVRDLLKWLMECLSEPTVPVVLSSEQRKRFQPLAELAKNMVDRKSNYLPAYFVINELIRWSTLRQQHRPFALWRDTDRVRNMAGLSDVLAIIVLEAMAASELDHAGTLLHWAHVVNLVGYSLLFNICSPAHFMHKLHVTLVSTKYKRARDDLIWCFVQWMSIHTRPGVGQRDCDLLLNLYNLLYTGEEEISVVGVNVAAARAMAPTCLWFNLMARAPENTLQPPPSIQSQLTFLEDSLRNDAALRSDDYLLAVLYSNDTSKFDKHLAPVLRTKLDVDDTIALPMGAARAVHRTRPLSVEFLSALTIHSRHILWKLLTVQSQLSANYQQNVAQSSASSQPGGFAVCVPLPSPAVLETFARLAAMSEPEHTPIKPILQWVPQCTSVLTSGNPADAVRTVAAQMLVIYCELFSYRCVLSTLPLPEKAGDSTDKRTQALLMAHNALLAAGGNAPLALAIEAVWDCRPMRMWVWMVPANATDLANRANLSAVVLGEETTRAPYSDHMLRLIAQVIARSVIARGWECAPELVSRLGQQLCWPEASLRALPAPLRAALVAAQARNAEALQHSRQVAQEAFTQEYVKIRTLKDDLLDYFTRDSAPPVFLCIMWQLIMENVQLPSIVYHIVDSLSHTRLLSNMDHLVDYLLHRLGQTVTNTTAALGQAPIDGSDRRLHSLVQAVLVVERMAYTHGFFPIERFLLALLSRPADDRETNVALCFMLVYLQKTKQLGERLAKCVDLLPSWRDQWTCDDAFETMARIYTAHQEQSAGDKYAASLGHPPAHPPTPTYFAHPAARLMPFCDMLLTRSLEDPSYIDRYFLPFLNYLAPIYKFHPQPLTFVLNTLHYNYSMCLGDRPDARAIFLVSIIDACGEPYSLRLSAELRQRVANSDSSTPGPAYYRVLLENIATAVDRPQPATKPDYDWRFAECPAPSTLTLHLSAAEVLAVAPAPCTDLSPGQPLIDVIMKASNLLDGGSVFARLNALGLLLTSLPPVFTEALHTTLEQAVRLLADGVYVPADAIANFERACYSAADDKHLRALAIAHAVYQHGSLPTLASLAVVVCRSLAPVVSTETQLLYLLRVVTPFMNRLYSDHSNRHNEQITLEIYKTLLRVDKSVEILEYEDTLCDFLYHLKYMYVGDALKNDTDPIVAHLRPSVQNKLRYLSAQQSNTTASVSEQTQ